jgi:hypothetical protein
MGEGRLLSAQLANYRDWVHRMESARGMEGPWQRFTLTEASSVESKTTAQPNS